MSPCARAKVEIVGGAPSGSEPPPPSDRGSRSQALLRERTRETKPPRFFSFLGHGVPELTMSPSFLAPKWAVSLEDLDPFRNVGTPRKLPACGALEKEL